MRDTRYYMLFLIISALGFYIMTLFVGEWRDALLLTVMASLIYFIYDCYMPLMRRVIEIDHEQVVRRPSEGFELYSDVISHAMEKSKDPFILINDQRKIVLANKASKSVNFELNCEAGDELKSH